MLIECSKIHCAISENIHKPPPPPPTPQEISVASYLLLILTFKSHPLPLRFPMTFHGVGMDFFLELHIVETCHILTHSKQEKEKKQSHKQTKNKSAQVLM